MHVYVCDICIPKVFTRCILSDLVIQLLKIIPLSRAKLAMFSSDIFIVFKKPPNRGLVLTFRPIIYLQDLQQNFTINSFLAWKIEDFLTSIISHHLCPFQCETYFKDIHIPRSKHSLKTLDRSALLPISLSGFCWGVCLYPQIKYPWLTPRHDAEYVYTHTHTPSPRRSKFPKLLSSSSFLPNSSLLNYLFSLAYQNQPGGTTSHLPNLLANFFY